MPHPERHVQRTQHPEWTRLPEKKTTDPVGLLFFKAAVQFADEENHDSADGEQSV